MNGQEFATAVQYGLPIVIVVADNGLYGTIRMHQEREYPGRIIAHRPAQSGFRRLCARFGGFGVTVEHTADFPAAFREAEASGKPAIIQLAIDPEAITPMTTLCEDSRQIAGAKGK